MDVSQFVIALNFIGNDFHRLDFALLGRNVGVLGRHSVKDIGKGFKILTPCLWHLFKLNIIFDTVSIQQVRTLRIVGNGVVNGGVVVARPRLSFCCFLVTCVVVGVDVVRQPQVGFKLRLLLRGHTRPNLAIVHIVVERTLLQLLHVIFRQLGTATITGDVVKLLTDRVTVCVIVHIAVADPLTCIA